MDLAKLQGGSGIIRYRGLVLESKDGIKATPELTTFDVAIDGISKKADQRVTEAAITVSVTPTGKWVNPERLYPYLNWPLGRLVLPVLAVTINTGTDVLSSTNHLLITGDRVMVGIRNGGTLPTSAPQVDEDAWYFARVLTANTFTLHSTRADAVAGTSAINFATAGSDVVVVAQFDLEIIAEDGERFTFHAAAISQQPEFNGTATETPFGEVQWRIFVRNRKQWSDDDAFFTRDTPGFPGWVAAAEDIKTQSPWVAWANQLKVSAIDTDDDTLTVAGHGLASGAILYIGSTGSLPTAAPALNVERKYFAHAVDVNTLTLHLTEADGTSGDDPVDLTAAGGGDLFITVDNPPFTLLDTEAGVKITSACELEDRKSDRAGVYNAKLTDATQEATFIALGLGAKDLFSMLKVQGAGAYRGRSMSANSRQLNVFSAGMYVRINGASPKKSDLAWNMTDDRARELTMVNTRVVVAGALQPVGVVGTQIP